MAEFMALYNNFGDYMKYERIRNLREDKDLTQQQVADMLFVNRRTYAAYENGVNSMTPETLIKLAKLHNAIIQTHTPKIIRNYRSTVYTVDFFLDIHLII